MRALLTALLLVTVLLWLWDPPKPRSVSMELDDGRVVECVTTHMAIDCDWENAR